METTERILVGFDFSPCSTLALKYGIDLAQATGAELDIIFVEVLHGETMNESTRHKLTQLVDEQLRRRAATDLKVTKSVERYFAAAPAILDHAERLKSDVIVVGTHGRRGLRALMLGSVAQEIVRGADVPVLTVRGKDCKDLESHIFKRILVPFDFSGHSRKALQEAVDIAKIFKAEVTVLNVIEERFHPAFYGPFFQSIHDIDPDIDQKTLDHLNEEIESFKDSGIDIGVDVVSGYPGTRINAYAHKHEIDLIVMSTHGLSGLARLSLGSVAEHTIGLAHRPVLTLRRHEIEKEDSEAEETESELQEV